MTELGRQLARDFDIETLSPDFYEDPYPTYAALRAYAPVKRMRGGACFLTRHADLTAIYRDSRTFSSDKRVEFGPKYGDTPLFEHHTGSLVFNDPPLHTRVRRLIAGALTPRAIAALEPGLVALVDTLLDRLDARREIDLIEDFAAAIPVEVIGNLLDVPRGERGPLRQWSLAILGALEPVPTRADLERGNAAVRAFSGYLETLIQRRRAAPGDRERDVLTRLIEGEAGGEKLTGGELVHNCIFLLNAGHETTTNLIGNGLVALAEHVDQRERLVAQPAMLKTAVEEILRFESSNQLGNRMTRAPVTLGGVAVPAGTPLTLCIGAANRDAAEFDDPERFDVGRAPNRHLAFGAGIHQCAGLSLARMEGALAIGRFLQRFPHYRLLGSPVRGGRARFRGLLQAKCAVHEATGSGSPRRSDR